MAFVGAWGAGLQRRGRVAASRRGRYDAAERRTRVSMAAPPTNKIEPDPNDVLLAELRFSDPVKLPNIINFNRPRLGHDFFAYIDSKISSESDLEERQNLSLLKDAIKDILKRQSGLGAEEDGAPSVNREDTYEQLLNAMLSYQGSVQAAVDAYYPQIDQDFLKVLAEKSADAKVQELLNTIYVKMSKVVEEATKNLGSVLKCPNKEAMEKSLAELHKKGKLDETFMLLLTGNIEQARQAGAEGPLRVMNAVQSVARGILDDSVSADMRLIRQLMREDSVDRRRELLADAFQPTTSFVIDEDQETGVTKVDGKEFVKSMAKLMQEFGNVKEDLQKKLQVIAREAEEVARDMFGLREKDIKELQDEAYQKKSISVWELEQVEMQSEMMGQQAPWEQGNPPPGFDESGTRIV